MREAVASFSSRIDQNIGGSDRIFGQFHFQNEHAPQPSIIPLLGLDVKQNARLMGLS